MCVRSTCSGHRLGMGKDIALSARCEPLARRRCRRAIVSRIGGLAGAAFFPRFLQVPGPNCWDTQVNQVGAFENQPNMTPGPPAMEAGKHWLHGCVRFGSNCLCKKIYPGLSSHASGNAKPMAQTYIVRWPDLSTDVQAPAVGACRRQTADLGGWAKRYGDMADTARPH